MVIIVCGGKKSTLPSKKFAKNERNFLRSSWSAKIKTFKRGIIVCDDDRESLEGGVTLVPVGRLFVGMADPKQAALAERTTQQLKTHGEIYPVAVGKTARQA